MPKAFAKFDTFYREVDRATTEMSDDVAGPAAAVRWRGVDDGELRTRCFACQQSHASTTAD